MRGFDLSSIEKDPQASAIALYAHWGAFILSKDGKTLTKAHDEAGLDLGGIAKGWAIDKCVEALVAAGFKDIYMEWGGDVRVKGHHPTGRRWFVTITEPPSLSALRKAIPAVVASPGLTRSESLRRRADSGNANAHNQQHQQHQHQDHPQEPCPLRRLESSLRRRGESSGLGTSPRERGASLEEGEAGVLEAMASVNINAADEGTHAILAQVSLRDGVAITTSGDYMQAYWFGDRLFFHIFNPKTKRLLEVEAAALAQATVVTDSSCMYADALATTALAMGAVPKDARKFLDGLSTLGVEDYLLYAREGPKVIRLRLRGSEAEIAREIRWAQHEPARVVVIGGGLAGFAAAIEAAKCVVSVV
jgi:hypothetical protein